ncbi:glycosyltransferase family 4 protein [bacterium]|nr:glycosyltransferase family 4 protein [bacterium]
MSIERVLLVHNFYQMPGGEDRVFATEAEMLRQRGLQVSEYIMHNDRISTFSPLQMMQQTVWNSTVYYELRQRIQSLRPQVVHFHNTFPLVSPAGYYAAREEGVAVVQTLHNYRLLCVNAMFFREGAICESCLGKALPLEGVLRACYRGSHAASLAAVTTTAIHRMLGTWDRVIDRYIALSEFARSKFVEGGLPADKIWVKPNTIHPDYGVGTGGEYALYVGRLSAEKGVTTLLQAWQEHDGLPPLKIVGDGPEAALVAEAVERRPSIEWLGRQPKEEIARLMRGAKMLLLPSLVYENFPATLVEAYSSGLPIIASDIGSLRELVGSGTTGLLFAPGDPTGLATEVRRLAQNGPFRDAMGQQARDMFERQFSEDVNYNRLMMIYREAITASAQEKGCTGEPSGTAHERSE